MNCAAQYPFARRGADSGIYREAGGPIVLRHALPRKGLIFEVISCILVAYEWIGWNNTSTTELYGIVLCLNFALADGGLWFFDISKPHALYWGPGRHVKFLLGGEASCGGLSPQSPPPLRIRGCTMHGALQLKVCATSTSPAHVAIQKHQTMTCTEKVPLLDSQGYDREHLEAKKRGIGEETGRAKSAVITEHKRLFG